jgi:predicted alpha/beta hydrolase
MDAGTAEVTGEIGRDISLSTADGVALAATLFEPPQSNGVAVQINSSSATPRQYYRAFATHLAKLGFTVLSYDYRGIGGSKSPAPGADDQSIVLSGIHDQTAAADFLLTNYPGHVLTLVAHSLGGQIVGLTPRASQFKALFVMGTAQGYWRSFPGPARWRAWLKFHVTIPFALWRYGRVPPTVTGFEMPPTMAREMRRFCLHPRWLVDENGVPLRPYNAEIRGRLWLLGLEDDIVVPPAGLIDLDDFFPNAPRRVEHRAPGHYGMAEVGHFGFFRRSMPVAAWDEVADWLLQSKTAS